jgi:hypothetical protein
MLGQVTTIVAVENFTVRLHGVFSVKFAPERGEKI